MSQVIRRTGGAGQAVATSDVPDDRPISEVVVETVAAVEGIEPNDLSVPLYEAVDPDALDALERSAADRTGTLRLEFTFAEYEVAVEAGDRITVREPTDGRVR